jgi:hypothetical protein
MENLDKGKVVRLAKAFNNLKASPETRYYIYSWMLGKSEPIKGHDLKLTNNQYQTLLKAVGSFCSFCAVNGFFLNEYGKQYFYFQMWKGTHE